MEEIQSGFVETAMAVTEEREAATTAMDESLMKDR